MRKKNRTYHKRLELIDGFRCQSHPIYHVWSSMMSRCYDPAQASYAEYGARGIKVDSHWHHFKNFAKEMGIRPGAEWTIERKDNEQGYGPENCVWASRSDQCVNRRLFKTNTTGTVGVVKVGKREWHARFDYLGVRYRIGCYRTLDEASSARNAFASLFKSNQHAALATLTSKDKVVWNSSSTRRRGVTPHGDGGYIARCTIQGVRRYIGYFKTIEEAEYARSRFIKEKAR